MLSFTEINKYEYYVIFETECNMKDRLTSKKIKSTNFRIFENLELKSYGTRLDLIKVSKNEGTISSFCDPIENFSSRFQDLGTSRLNDRIRNPKICAFDFFYC